MNSKSHTYEGEWKDNQKHGKGEYIHENGQRFKGEYKDGKRDGPGVLNDINVKEVIRGIWKDGKLTEKIN